MALADEIKSRWKSNQPIKSEKPVDETPFNPIDIESITKGKYTFKQKVDKLANMYSDLKTSNYMFNRDFNSDLKSFWFLKMMLDKNPEEVIAVTGYLAVKLHHFMKKNNTKHTYVGDVKDRLKLEVTDGVNLRNPGVWREITSNTKTQVVVFCNYRSLWKYLRSVNLDTKKYLLAWYRDPNMDNMLVYSFSKNYVSKEAKLAVSDIKSGDYSSDKSLLKDIKNMSMSKWNNYLNHFTTEDKVNRFDIFLFGKDIARNTTA